MNKFVLGFAILSVSAGAAFAQTSFADVDTDANGELGYAELQVAWPDLAQAEFDAADADASGGLSVAELNSLQAAAAPAPAAPAADGMTAVPPPAM